MLSFPGEARSLSETLGGFFWENPKLPGVPGSGEYNQAKLAAYVVVAGFMALLLVFGLRSASGPHLYPGDRQVSLPCPVCSGSGQGRSDATRCASCLGAKKLKAVQPGPEHPAEVRGSVRTLSAFKDRPEAEAAAAHDALHRAPGLTPVKGAVGSAQLLWEGPQGGERVPVKATGIYVARLTPGTYRLTVEAPGFRPWHQEVVVPARQEPIWPEVVPPESHPPERLQLDLFLETSP